MHDTRLSRPPDGTEVGVTEREGVCERIGVAARTGVLGRPTNISINIIEINNNFRNLRGELGRAGEEHTSVFTSVERSHFSIIKLQRLALTIKEK
jgi:hypothetical protein